MFAGVLQHNYKGFIMATTDLLHKNLTDPQLHEPKGISTATENAVYFADGKGKGVWKPVTFDRVSFNAPPVAATEMEDTPDVRALDHSDLSQLTNGMVEHVNSFEGCDKNFKELAEECEQLRNSLEVAHKNLAALNQTVEELRTSLTDIGVLANA